jgi:hypothetical protein
LQVGHGINKPIPEKLTVLKPLEEVKSYTRPHCQYRKKSDIDKERGHDQSK